MTVNTRDTQGSAANARARQQPTAAAGDHLMTREQLLIELTALRREYGVLQDMLAQAWVDAGAHGAGEAELRLIVESLPLPIMIYRRCDHRIMFASGKLEPLLGTSTATLVGAKYSAFCADPEGVVEADAQLAKRGVLHGHELRLRRQDGSLFWTAVSLKTLEYRGEDAVLCALVDISERIEMAERLERARQQAESASVAKSTFLAHMSHELRNPLNAIIGYAEMLVERAEELGDAEFTEDSERILKVAKMQLGIIGDSLDLAKIEAGHMSFQRVRFRVAELMREVVTAARPLVQRNANLFEVSIGRSLGNAVGDPTRIRQILLNLLGNAAKFTHEGRVSLTVRRESRPGGGDTLSFRVGDTGVGMAPEDVERLFSPFFQARDGRALAGGTGLGLAISQQLARSMGGDITVTSRVSEGSTFSLYLPYEAPETASEASSRAR